MNDIPTTPTFRLDGKRALVTGAGRGLGQAFAAALAQAGAHVTLLARSRDEIEAVAAALRKSGLKADALALDVTDLDTMRTAIAAAEPFNILINNAGTNRPGPFLDTKVEDFDYVLNINVRAAYFVAQAVARRLVEAKQPGSIINVSSQMGVVGSPRRTLYCASKHAMEGMTKALAWELGTAGIRVNTLCPTFIETAMTSGMFAEPAFRTWVCDRIALGRLGRVEEIMGAVVFLASDASSLMTGSALMLDGGWSAA